MTRDFDLNFECSAREDDCNNNDDIGYNSDFGIDSDDDLRFDLDDQEINSDFGVDFIGDVGNEYNSDCEPNDAESIVCPYVGMILGSVDEVIRHCHEYGNANGFRIKIRSSERIKNIESTTVENVDGFKRLRLVYSKGGKFLSRSNNPKRIVNTCVTGCPFKVNASLCADSLWKITKVVPEHNHRCEPENSRFFPRYRYISPENEKRILNNDMAGVPIAKSYNSFVLQYGGHDKVPFDERDCRNLVNKARRLSLKDGDFVAMRRYFDYMCSTNSNFFYMYDTDENGTLRNVFWADGRSRAAYKDFGDIVSFDTTYVSNRYRMPFAPFIGVNNHGQSILFGCALLAGEEIENFVWLFKAWLSCMFEKAPKGILTDQCRSIGNAVAEVFPETRHRWCIWHIMRNAKKHLGKHPQWKDIYKRLRNTLHDTLTISEFLNSWQDWITEYGLESYNWCCDMYAERHRWVPIYFKEEFWAGMSSTQRSEGMNFFFKGFLNVNTTLKQFVEQYGFALAKRVKEEDKETHRSIDSPILCGTEHIFEHVFQKLYTSVKFVEFQNQVKGMTYTNATKKDDDGRKCIYEVVVKRLHHGKRKHTNFNVTMERQTLDMRCDCKNFEFNGIMCSHLLRVFHEEELDFVPEKYILDRWRKDLPREHLKVPVPYYSLLGKKPSEMKRYETMQSSFEPICTLAMTNETLFDEVMTSLSSLSLKAKEITGDSHGLMFRSLNDIGKVYGKRVVPNAERICQLEVDGNNNNSNHVKDPIDKRGRGRPPVKRKGYNERPRARKRSKHTTNSSNVPDGFGIPHGIQTYTTFNQP